MSFSRTLTREFASYSAGYFFMQLITIGLAIFIRNVLGPEQMGVWVSLQVILNYTKYSNLGLANAAGREIPFEKGRQRFDRAESIRNVSFTFTIVIALFLSLAMAVAAFVLRGKMGELFFYSLLALSFLSFFQRASTFCISLLRAEKQFLFINRFNVYSALANAVLTVLLITGLGLYGYYLSMILSFVLNFIYVLRFSNVRFRLDWDWRELSSLFKMGVGLIVVNIFFTFLSSVDKISISALLGFKALGIYSLVIMASSLVTAFPNNLGVITFPYLNETYGASNDSARLRKLAVYPTLFMAVYMPLMVAFLWMLGPWAVRTFLPQYVDGISAMKVGLFATLFMILLNNMSDTLVTFKKYLWMIPVQGFLGVACLIINAAVIAGGGGITSVAWVTFGAYLTLYVVYAALALRTLFGRATVFAEIFKVVFCASYPLILLFLLDRWLPENSSHAQFFRPLAAMLGSAPLLFYGQRRFGTSRLLVGIFQQNPTLGRLLLYSNIRRYWERRGGKRYFEEQESRKDRGETSRFLAREIGGLGGASILEVGCGYGKVLKSLREFTAAPLTGIDFSRTQLEKAKEYLSGLEGITLIQGDAESLPFPDGTFDVVFTSNVILHNPPKKADKMRREILRVSKKYVVHKEDTDINFSRYGYDHARIYQEMGLKVLRAEKVNSAVDADITQFTVVQKN